MFEKENTTPSPALITRRLSDIQVMIKSNTKILQNPDANLGEKLMALSELTTLVKIESSLKE